MDIKTKILEVLEKTHLMSLAVKDDGGVWVADVIFIFDENLNIYWMSDPDVRHSKAILNNENVAGTITASTKSKELNLGIQFSGVAKKIDGQRYDLALKHLKKRNHPEPKETDDVLEGDSWYQLTPIKIDLVDEKNQGYDKKSLEL
ncbi:MAG: hypothetical protein A3I19_01230 [Candidatus Zambryskibacteria bacterium RIFCSPLOWO2_02_FULL_38_13]|nr:MAG: hypothetical protein A3I19_01230 [Candidatus Zambryskibacteria bacterium RIFCSPLOWO2_02_FULL_38_13]